MLAEPSNDAVIAGGKWNWCDFNGQPRKKFDFLSIELKKKKISFSFLEVAICPI